MPQNYDACFPATTPPTLYTGTGTTTAFATGFPSLKQNDIVVFTGDNTTRVWTIAPQTDYTVNSQNAQNVQQVVFTTAPGSDVLIMRRTDLCVLVRNFQAGQSIRAQDLNNAFLQQLYLQQEMYSFIEQQFGTIILDGTTLQDVFWNKTTDTIDSGEAWVSDDDHIATTLAGDNRWLNATGGNVIGGNGITVVEGGGNVTINQETLNPSPAGTFNNPVVTVDALGRVTAIIDGNSADGLAIVANTLNLNTLAATLGAADSGTAVLVNDSTNIDGTVGTPGANNPAPNPAVAGLPADAPAGGWNDTVQTSVQWTGAAWQFIRFGSANPDQRYINAVDGTPSTAADRQNIRFNGLDLVSNTTQQGADIVGYELRFGANNTPQMALNGGTTENATLQVAFGDQSGGPTTHGVYISSGDTLNKFGSVLCTGDDNSPATVFSYVNVLGTNSEQNQFFLRTNGDFETTGNIILASTNARAQPAPVQAFDLTIGATPTADYSITFPPAGPGADNRILESDTNGNLSWIATPSAGAGLWEESGNFLRPVANNDGVQIRNGANVTITLNREGGAVFNETGGNAENCDFRIESDDNQRMFFMNASQNNILIGNANNTANAETVLDIIGGVRNRENTIGANWNLDLGNMWTVGGTTAVPNPTNMEQGMSGVIVVTTTTVTWPAAGGATIQYTDNTPPNITAVPAVIPFYCDSDSTILLGTPTQGIT